MGAGGRTATGRTAGARAPDLRTRDLEPGVDLGPTLDFMRVLWALDHAVQRTSKRMERHLGATGPQRLVLRIVGRFPGISAGRLARLLHVHPSTLTGVLSRLDRRGLLRRRPDPRDGRRWQVALTPRGREMDVEAEGTVEAAVQHALDHMRPADIEGARAVLVAIAERLGSGPPAHDARPRRASVGVSRT